MAKLATSFALLFFAIPVPASAQTVTLSNGNSCTYTGATYTSATQAWSFQCSGGSPTSATVTFGPATGSLGTTVNSSATIAVSCSGACTGISSTATVTQPTSGVSVSGSISNGIGTITVNGTAPLAPGNAVVQFSAPAGAGGGITVSPSTTTNVNVAIADVSAKGVVGFALTTAPATTGNPTTVAIVRSGAGAQAANATASWACYSGIPGYTPTYSNGSSTGSFQLVGNQTQSFTITPTTLPPGITNLSVGCYITQVFEADTVPTGTTFELTITPGNGGGGGGGVPPGCPATTATMHDTTATAGNPRVLVIEAGTSSAAVKFSAARAPQMSGRGMLTMPVPGYNQPYGVDFAISECPGVFTPVNPTESCGYFSISNGSLLEWGTTPSAPFWYCKLDAAKSYYFNVRYFNPQTNQSACGGTCAVYLDMNYSN